MAGERRGKDESMGRDGEVRRYRMKSVNDSENRNGTLGNRTEGKEGRMAMRKNGKRGRVWVTDTVGS